MTQHKEANMTVKVYHNNKKALECDKLGHNGAKAAVKIGEYVAQTCAKSRLNTIHTFEVKSEHTRQILCAYYDFQAQEWKTKEVCAINA